jgi:hypothetical protein
MTKTNLTILRSIKQNRKLSKFVCVLPNQALPEGIPLGQADGCQPGTLTIAGGGFSFLLFSF